jgi:hypothetical protein
LEVVIANSKNNRVVAWATKMPLLYKWSVYRPYDVGIDFSRFYKKKRIGKEIDNSHTTTLNPV